MRYVIADPRDLNAATDHALLLLSGGLDSAVAGAILRDAGVRTTACTLTYASRPPKEAEAARRVSRALGIINNVELSIPVLDDGRLEPSRRLLGHHEAWFPYRNAIFFAIAAHIALDHGCNVIAAGIRVWDGRVFNDASLEYFERLGELLQYSGRSGDPNPPRLFLPFINDHALIESVCLSEKLWSEVLSTTWSCWRHEVVPCGTCSPCLARARFRNRITAKRRYMMEHDRQEYELASDFQPLPGEACFPPTIEREVVGGTHIAPEFVTRHGQRFIMVEWPNGLPRHESERTVRFPHGLLRFGESIEECATRLVQDQLGMEVEGIRTVHLDSYLDERGHWHIEPIVLVDVSGTPRLPTEAGGVVYFEGDALPDGSVWSSRDNFRRKVLQYCSPDV